MLHVHNYDFQTVRDKFRLPFKHDCPIQNKVQIECFGVVRVATILFAQRRVSQRYVNRWPTGTFKNECLRFPHRSQSILVFHVLTLRTKLLHAHEVRHMCFCRVGIPLILGGLENIKYIQYLVHVSRQNVLEKSQKTQVSHHSVLFTCLTIPFTPFILIPYLQYSTGRAASLALTVGFLYRYTIITIKKFNFSPSSSKQDAHVPLHVTRHSRKGQCCPMQV